jgi:arginyl-tRNA--protein-N-Asp/Glu arginylyltransferase
VATNSRPNADRLRLFTEESIAVHEQYRSDEESLRQFRHFINWQVAYLLPFFSEFERRPDTAAAVEFIVSDLMGSGVS